MPDHPSLDAIARTAARIAPFIVATPVRRWQDDQLDADVPGASVFLKEELFQRAGTFKPRGALSVMLDLDGPALSRGVTAASGGNHAAAVAYAARALGTTAKVVMPKAASPSRVAACRAMGAEVVFVENVHRVFERAQEIAAAEHRTLVHPFEGPLTALGTATLGLELCDQLKDIDALIIAIGGGGLAAGVACAVKLIQPACRVYGVEPEGADTMRRSLDAGSPQSIDAVRTVADSLGAPYALPYSFELCRRYLDDVVLVSDEQIVRAMHLLFRSAKLAVEPAGAAAVAALRGPLRDRVTGKRVAVIVCGANIDAETFGRLIVQGQGG